MYVLEFYSPSSYFVPSLFPQSILSKEYVRRLKVREPFAVLVLLLGVPSMLTQSSVPG